MIATDSYNTAAKIAYHTAETLPEIPRLPIIPIYSEYQDTWITTLTELEDLSSQGNVKYIMAASDMKTLKFEFWSWLNRHADDVTIMTGLPFNGEMRVFRIRKECDLDALERNDKPLLYVGNGVWKSGVKCNLFHRN